MAPRSTDELSERAGSSVAPTLRGFGLGLVAGAVLILIFHGLVVKLVLIAALIVLAVGVARIL